MAANVRMFLTAVVLVTLSATLNARPTEQKYGFGCIESAALTHGGCGRAKAGLKAQTYGFGRSESGLAQLKKQLADLLFNKRARAEAMAMLDHLIRNKEAKVADEDEKVVSENKEGLFEGDLDIQPKEEIEKAYGKNVANMEYGFGCIESAALTHAGCGRAKAGLKAQKYGFGRSESGLTQLKKQLADLLFNRQARAEAMAMLDHLIRNKEAKVADEDEKVVSENKEGLFEGDLDIQPKEEIEKAYGKNVALS